MISKMNEWMLDVQDNLLTIYLFLQLHAIDNIISFWYWQYYERINELWFINLGIYVELTRWMKYFYFKCRWGSKFLITQRKRHILNCFLKFLFYFLYPMHGTEEFFFEWNFRNGDSVGFTHFEGLWIRKSNF